MEVIEISYEDFVALHINPEYDVNFDTSSWDSKVDKTKYCLYQVLTKKLFRGFQKVILLLIPRETLIPEFYYSEKKKVYFQEEKKGFFKYYKQEFNERLN